MTLKHYHEKRNFKKTTEPKGKQTPAASKSQHLFVIQKHAARHLHYDLRLELKGVLLSWAVPKGPCLDTTVKRLAIHVEDHPLEYASFEGIIPKGQYGAGTVMLWDKGQWIPEDNNPTQAYQQGNMTFTLKSKKLKGRWKLIRLNQNDKTWLLMKLTDKYARLLQDYDITQQLPNSVASQQSLEEIAEKYQYIWDSNHIKKNNSRAVVNLDLAKSPFPKMNIRPQLATIVDLPPRGRQWIHEIKYDGYRLLAYKNDKQISLTTRNNHDWTEKFANIRQALENLALKRIIVDGEVVVLDKNHHPNFQLLQNSIKENIKTNFVYYIFDLLYYDHYNLMSLALTERKKILKKILKGSDESVLCYSEHFNGAGAKIFHKICELGLEGIISKDKTSEYVQKRSKSWLKTKCLKHQEFVVAGFTAPKGQRAYFGSLVLGVYNKRQEFIYCGNVGTGFSEASLKELYSKLVKNITQHSSFSKKIPGNETITWVKPTLIVDVAFSEWTKASIIRHPSFKGLVENSNEPHNTPAAKIINFPYHLTNPDKKLYAEEGITKKQLISYYDTIQHLILPYINLRPLTLLRCPDGYQHCFYQRHLNKSMPPDLYGIMIKEQDKKEACIYIKDTKGLIALAQLATLEIHPWNSRIEDIEHPDMIIFDLDPAPDVTWKTTVAAAFGLKKNLSQLKLKSFVKTTGGKGLHIVVPIKAEYGWGEIKSFTRTLAKYMEHENNTLYISTMSKTKRKGKIYIDYLRNQRGATAVAAYSTRARRHAPVSVPIDWDELTDNFNDTFYTIQTLPQRLKHLRTDPWQQFFKLKQSLDLEKYK